MLFRKLCKMTYYCIFKIDRLYDWKKSPDTDVAVTLKKQKKNTKDEFEERAKAIIVEFAKQVGWNIEGSLANKSDSKGGGWCGLCVWVFAWGFGFIFFSFFLQNNLEYQENCCICSDMLVFTSQTKLCFVKLIS